MVDNAMLTDEEAKEFDALYKQGFSLYIAVCIFAHIASWMWRPWIPGPEGFAALESATQTLTFLA